MELQGAPLVEQVACPTCGKSIPLSAYRFCPVCAGELVQQADIERRPRLVCRSCGFIFVRNPVPGVAVVLMEEDRILLALRRYTRTAGMWCIPCGKVEPGEDVREAARREFLEETGLKVEIGDPIFVHSSFHKPHRPVLGIWFLGRVLSGEMAASSDVSEVRFFPLEAPPPNLAFEGDKLVIDKLQRSLR